MALLTRVARVARMQGGIVRHAQALTLRSLAAAWQVSSRRSFAISSEGSHSDFQAQRKESNMEDPEKVQEIIRSLVDNHNIFLFMKGTPTQPMCGFSAQVVRILHSQGVAFDSVNVLDHPEVREGIKKFSNWPTIPQLYINGEFIGGCDIITSLHNSGELSSVLSAEKDTSEPTKQ